MVMHAPRPSANGAWNVLGTRAGTACAPSFTTAGPVEFTDSTTIESMGEDFCVFNPVFIPSRLPFEIILLILDRLSDSDKLSLRILDKEWNSIFHGHLDSKLYHNISIRHTGRSYRLLRELSLDPVLSKHVQSIAHSSCTLPLQTEIIEFFDTYLT